MAEEKKEISLDIVISDTVASGCYSNLQIVQHSQTEFILDFIQRMPHVPKAVVKSRVILSPIHAKKLLKTLQSNINHFEMTFGQIKEEQNEQMDITHLNPLGTA